MGKINMRERTYSTEGIILKRRNWGEADKILTIFSKNHGKIRVVGKGVRRPTSRKRGSLELFSYTHIMLANGRSLDIITDAEIKESFDSWREDLVKVGVAYHLCEIVDRLTAEQQENKEVFNLLLASLRSLENLDYWQLYPLTENFKVKVLEELGFLERQPKADQPRAGIPKNLDAYIENLINGSLRTKRFLKTLTT
ncbi:MAG: DNA repair protein RecO [Candidatus Blackburnbacteria bacterium RIFCSPLOWO2_02_FULL_44_9]|nr:MAG: DNA repair protein RecO [Candidatus Blackburnbacteria bacterium RIFCSPLOWO2_01_FULL_44_43]OGY15768.1 MAG: DNA repair protein RecO [Candidatus Blackburnbacteria bacterium RIFCSPLOWO2_02_FULL_44_9]